jgi:ParB/RepB/Spo0J family partition protein
MSNTHDVFIIELRRLADSPSQPRTEYHGLDELADSIRQQGVLQPIICRPITQQPIGADPAEDLEIIAGHRRVRAARMAELEDIPAIIRPMSDLQVLQVQIVENLQREDVSPLDEGRAYAALRDQHGQTPKQIADTLGVSVRHVLARIQLLQLTGSARKALADGLIGSDIALLICAIPSTVHDKALELVTRTLETGERLALPVRAARANLRSAKLLHSIREAPFNIDLPALIDSAGPCLHYCPRLSNHMGDQVLEQLGADVCTDRTCYTAKLSAHTQRELGNLADNGWTVLDAEPEFGTWKKIEGDCIDNIAKAVSIDPTQRAYCIAWPDAVTGLHTQGVTVKGYTAILRLIYQRTPTPADAPANEGGEGVEEETTVATPRDTSDQEPKTLAHDGGMGAQEALRDEIAKAMLNGRGWPPSRSDLVLVCAALAFASGGHALAMTGLPSAHGGANRQLDELHRWPDSRLALTATALALFLAVEELPTDRATNLLVQLHTRYLDGEGDQSSRAAGAEAEDQTSLTAGQEVIDETPLTGRDQTDDAGASARPTTTAEAQYEAGQLTKPATQQRTTRKAPSARYQCPTTGQTWTGRGLKPRWLAEALHSGDKVLSDYDTQAEGSAA